MMCQRRCIHKPVMACSAIVESPNIHAQKIPRDATATPATVDVSNEPQVSNQSELHAARTQWGEALAAGPAAQSSCTCTTSMCSTAGSRESGDFKLSSFKRNS